MIVNETVTHQMTAELKHLQFELGTFFYHQIQNGFNKNNN